MIAVNWGAATVTFSKRHGFARPPTISFRYEAPDALRFGMVQAAFHELSYDQIRTSLCRTLRAAPDRSNWSEVPNIRDEVERLLQDAEWYQVYDSIEELVGFIEGTHGYDAAAQFAQLINELFVDIGAGWQLKAGEGIVIRGDAQFESAVQHARDTLSGAAFSVAENELREALSDISRRPDPDLTGAIHHALGALEAAARYVHGSNDPLSSIVGKIGLPKPLDAALEKMWGYSSTYGRHVSPTKVPSLNDAELIVHLSSAFCRYLVDSQKGG